LTVTDWVAALAEGIGEIKNPEMTRRKRKRSVFAPPGLVRPRLRTPGEERLGKKPRLSRSGPRD
jgi:hypothetical protein